MFRYFLLVLVTACFAEAFVFKFKPQDIEDDLKLFAEYHTKVGRTDNKYFIEMPLTDFKFEYEENSKGKFLKFESSFSVFNFLRIFTLFRFKADILYYEIDNGKFYLARRKSPQKLVPIKKDRNLRQTGNHMAKTQPYVSIRYFSLKEIEDEILKDYPDEIVEYTVAASRRENPPKHLVVPRRNNEKDSSNSQFIEFAFPSLNPPEAEGGLRALVVKGTEKRATISKAVDISTLVYNRVEKKFVFGQETNIWGIRMKTEGVLAVHDGSSEVKLLSLDDLTVLPTQKEMSFGVENILKIVREVEPCMSSLDYVYRNKEYYDRRVKFQQSGKFRIGGKVLTKIANIRDDGTLLKTKEFSVVISGLDYNYLGITGNTIYTDDSRLWIETFANKREYLLAEFKLEFF